MEEAQRGQEEEEGSSVGGWDQDGVPGAGSELGHDWRWQRPRPDDRSVDATLSCLGGGGGSLLLPPVNCCDPWTVMAWTVGISGRVIGVSNR